MIDSNKLPDTVPHAVDEHDLIHHLELPRTALSERIDALIRGIGNAVSWIWLVLVLVVAVNVVMRYVVGRSLIQLEELQWHLYAVGFLVGLAYCLESDDHVRIDIFHEKMSLTTQAWVEFYGLLLLLFPLLAVILIYGVPFVGYSSAVNEVSESPGGLPLRWLIKSMLLVGFALLALAGFSRLLRATSYLFGAPRPLTREG